MGRRVVASPGAERTLVASNLNVATGAECYIEVHDFLRSDLWAG
jgi:hypothetical protein